MQDRVFHIKISPEVIQNKIFTIPYDAGPIIPDPNIDPCCEITTTTTTGRDTKFATVYSSMTQLLSGGTGGTSLLTGMTVPIFLTQNTVDMGYYSVFDGLIAQKEVFNNFIFSATTGSPFTYYFYNTSDVQFNSFLQFSDYYLDWGDNTPQQTVTSIAPNFYSHTYSTNGEYTISLSGMNPWGSTVVTKKVYVPFSAVTITNPNGTAYFIPQGGSWSGTPLQLDYLFSGDSICDIELQASSAYTTVPFLVTGFTKSSLDDLKVYGKKTNLFAGNFVQGIKITGNSNTIGTFWGPSSNNTYTAYTINDIDYYDYPDGTTLFVVNSSGLTTDWLVCTALTKEEVYINVTDEIEIQSDVLVERGKNSGLETIIRLNEVDNVGDLTKYGYEFFKVINSET